MWQTILKRTKTYRREHRQHLIIDGLLLLSVLTLFVFILSEKLVKPEAAPPLGAGTDPARLALYLEGEARYFTLTGNQIGTGPYPPIALKRTTYWVFFEISAKGSASKRTSLSVKLAEHAKWTGQGSVPGSGWISAETDQAVVADLGDLAPETTFLSTLEVALTPLTVDEVIIKEIKLSGEDGTGQRVTYTHGEIH